MSARVQVHARPTHLERAALVAALAIAGIALLRTLVQIVPTVWFDVDPAVDPSPAGWGPPHTLALDALVLALAGLVYAVAAPRATRWDALVALAALLPGGVVAWHGAHLADDAWRGTGWTAALVSASALWTAVRALPRGGALRSALLAVLLAGAGPLAVRCGMQLGVEHAATVAHYEADRAAVLAANGWSAGSPQALLFERRLLQWEATGWFGLSNVVSSLLVAMALALGGMAWGGWRGLERGTSLLLVAVALGCAAVVAINGSKGALGAAVLGAGVAGGAWMAVRRSPRPSWPAILTVSAVAGVLVIVLLRGWAGEALGERSLLFRWQYMQGAFRAWWETPWTGAGPAGFAETYLRTRPDRAPEEVVSAHSMWVDWFAALGVVAACWVGLVAGWLWGAGRVVREALVRAEGAEIAHAPPEVGRRFLVAAMVVVCGASVAGAAVEAHALDAPGLAARAVGIALALGLTVAVVQALEEPSRGSALGILAGAVALGAHAQIEMTLWSAGSAAWVLAFMSLAAADPRGALPLGAGRSSRIPARPSRDGVSVAASTAGSRPAGPGASALLAGVALVAVTASGAVLVWAAVPAATETHRMGRAAAPLVELAQGHAGAASPVAAPRELRVRAAELLALGEGLFPPWSDRPLRLVASLEQWTIALAESAADAPDFPELAARALGEAEAAVRRAPAESVLGAAQRVALEAARTRDEPLAREALESARRWATAQLERSPRSVGAWLRLARVRDALGDAAGAREAYRRALVVDDSYALDPLRQMSAADRQAVQRAADRAP
jgi:hypothetical protein